MKSIYVRQATLNDIDEIMVIIDQAKALLKTDKNPQWQDGYPNLNSIKKDIDAKTSNVIVVNNVVAGYASISSVPEPNYTAITDGSWKNTSETYSTIHRVAISTDFKGMNLARILLITLISKATDQNIYNFRVDTHELNQRMQHILNSLGFTKRGTILVSNKFDPYRFGFELNLSH